MSRRLGSQRVFTMPNSPCSVVERYISNLDTLEGLQKTRKPFIQVCANLVKRFARKEPFLGGMHGYTEWSTILSHVWCQKKKSFLHVCHLQD